MSIKFYLLSKGPEVWQVLLPGFGILSVRRYKGGWAVPLDKVYVHFPTLLEALWVFSEQYKWGQC